MSGLSAYWVEAMLTISEPLRFLGEQLRPQGIRDAHSTDTHR